MKFKIILILFAFILFGCSVSESPEISKLNGNWKIFVGGEYSMKTKEVKIELADTVVLYDSISFDSIAVNRTNLKAVHRFGKDTIFRLDLNLTFEDRIWGYEILEISSEIDSIYIYGERQQQQ